MPDTVTVRDREGRAFGVPADQVAGYVAQGFAPETEDQQLGRLGSEVQSDIYGGIGGKIASFGAGALSTATLGLSDVAGEALGAGHTLRALREENPYATLGGELLGAFAPVGPAHALTGIGRKIISAGEGAGVLAKAGIATAGAAVEGAGFGGGQYLSQVALDDKPLAAEGFIGAMGHGALFAAPVGGLFSLGESTLLRARSLFPQQQVTREAARGIQREATATLGQSLADGDQMAQAIQRKIELTDAKIGMAESGERVTRRMFGTADPAALGDQVVSGVDKTQLVDALQKYQVSRAQLHDWIRHEADPELEAALIGLTGPAEVGEIGGRIEKRAGTMFEPELAVGTPVSPEFRELNDALDMRARQLDVTKAGKRPVPEDLIAGVGLEGQQFRPPTRVMKSLERTPEERALIDEAIRAEEQAAGVTGERSLEQQHDDIMARLKTLTRPEDVPLRRQLSKQADELLDRMSVAGEEAALPAAAAPPASSDPHPIAKGKTVAELKHPDETPENFVLRRMREQGVAFGPDKRFLGSLGIDWTVPENKALMLKMMRNGDAAFARADLVGAMDPEMVKASEIVDGGPGGFGNSSWHFIRDTGQPVKTLDELSAASRPSGLEDLHRVTHKAEMEAASAVAPATDTLTGQLRGMQSQLGAGADLKAMGAPARAEYAATKAERTAAAAEHFKAKATGSDLDPFFTDLTRPKTRDAYVAANIGRAMREEGSHAKALAKVEREWAEQSGTKVPAAEIMEHASVDPIAAWREQVPVGVNAAEYGNRRAALGLFEGKINKRIGKNVDMSPDLGRAAKAIGDYEESMASMAEVLGADAPPTAVAHAKALRAAMADQADASATSAAKAAQDIKTKITPGLPIGDTRTLTGGQTVVDDEMTKALRIHDMRTPAPVPAPVSAPAPAGSSVIGKLADVGTALEVLKAMGVHAPALSAIPVIGPILGLFLKARAVMSILGRKGGSIPRSTEGLVASRSAETRNRLNVATTALLEGGAKASRKAASFSAGPAVLLGTQLFPGDGDTTSKDPRKLYEARVDELARAQAPGAVAAAIGDRIQTSDPHLHDAIIAQVERGLKFLDGKAPKQTLMPGMLPGDGVWHPSKAALEEFGKYVHAVNDPASVLEDLARGHLSIEGAETLRVVYPALFAEAQRMLLEAAPKMQKTMPYPKRVAISIMYQIPIDGSMTPQHMQFLQPPPTAAVAPMPGAPPGTPQATPALTAPLQAGQQTMSPLDRRAGA